MTRSSDRSDQTEFFDAWAHTYDRQHGRRDFRERTKLFVEVGRKALDRCETTAPACIDLGCGPGAITSTLSAIGFNAIGVDASDAMIAIARGSLNDSLSKCSFVCEDIVAFLENFDGKADLIISSSVFEYLPDPVRVVELVGLRLKSAGVFAVSIPNWCSWLRRAEPVIIRRLPKARRYNRHWQNRLDESTLKGAAARSGLRPHNTRYFGHFELNGHTLFARWASSRRIGTMVFVEFERDRHLL